MAGLYFHIPFCKTRCVYCDFYSATSIADKSALIEAMCREMEWRKEYLAPSNSHKGGGLLAPEIRTVYFGGGTPSLLEEKDFEKLFAQIKRLTSPLSGGLGGASEITLEANPDDLSEEYLSMLRRFPFNRISIGVQSFNDDELRFLNRRHSKEQAVKAVEKCRKAGFDNISIDLMYGLPLQTLESWKNSLQTAVALNVEHISAYHLTYEPQTVLGKMLAEGKITPANEETVLAQFATLINTLKNNGFEHYEISNFAKKGFRSKHNSAYWQGKSYLGIGPSAHSYDGDSRQWNVADTKQYIQALAPPSPPEGGDVSRVGQNIGAKLMSNEQMLTSPPLGGLGGAEILSPTDKYNDYIITRLRTAEGIDLSEINQQFGKEFAGYCLKKAQPFIQSGKLEQTNSQIKTTASGIFISDYIMEKLMFA